MKNRKIAPGNRCRILLQRCVGAVAVVSVAAGCGGDDIEGPGGGSGFQPQNVAASLQSLQFAPSNIALLQVALAAEALGLIDPLASVSTASVGRAERDRTEGNGLQTTAEASADGRSGDLRLPLSGAIRPPRSRAGSFSASRAQRRTARGATARRFAASAIQRLIATRLRASVAPRSTTDRLRGTGEPDRRYELKPRAPKRRRSSRSTSWAEPSRTIRARSRTSPTTASDPVHPTGSASSSTISTSRRGSRPRRCSSSDSST